MEVMGYFIAVLVGLSLGLVGSGGSILTVPVLVYVMGINPMLGTAYSLFIVGLSSLVGATRYAWKGLVDLRIGLVFAIPSMLGVYLTRRFLLPALPDQLSILSYNFEKGQLLMILFALLMLVAAWSMLHERGAPQNEEKAPRIRFLPVISEGLVVGVITGLVGAGGGFLIIPALILFSGLPMRLAVGTSLMIITIKSLFGFLGDVGQQQVDWFFLLIFTMFALVGSALGVSLSKRFKEGLLKNGFALFLLVLGVFILLKEFL
jgi:hypothetical protein